MSSQYEEDFILSEYFGKPPHTQKEDWLYLVDVGAADGVEHSNSCELLKWGWEGLLIEPNPQYFQDLLIRYSRRPHVQLSHYAISDIAGTKKFYLNQQCSSLVYPVGTCIEVQATTLAYLFYLYKVPHHFEFMSVDCEGHDMAVLKSLDWNAWSIALVCVEHSMDKEVLDSFMKSVGYKLFTRTMGNSFYEKKS